MHPINEKNILLGSTSPTKTVTIDEWHKGVLDGSMGLLKLSIGSIFGNAINLCHHPVFVDLPYVVPVIGSPLH